MTNESEAGQSIARGPLVQRFAQSNDASSPVAGIACLGAIKPTPSPIAPQSYSARTGVLNALPTPQKYEIRFDYIPLY